jgi:hypothetical protein
MNRKEYGLLVEGWRKFINESEATSLRDLHLHRSVEEPLRVNEIREIKINKFARYTVSLENGDKEPAPAPSDSASTESQPKPRPAIARNPFRLICSQLFEYGEDALTSPYLENHWGRFQVAIKKLIESNKKKILYHVLSADDATREKQLLCIFDVMQRADYFPKLGGGSKGMTMSDETRDNEEELKTYIPKYRQMLKNGQMQKMCKDVVDALIAKGLLLPQLVGEDPYKSNDESEVEVAEKI